VLFEKLKTRNINIWNTYTKHEFADKLVSEELSQRSFDYYIQQDYYYLLIYLDAIEKLAQFPNAKECFTPIIEGVRIELKHHTKSDTSDINPSIATKNYTQYLKNLIKMSNIFKQCSNIFNKS